MKKILPLLALAIAASRSNGAPAFSEGWQPKPSPVYVPGAPLPQPAGAAVTVNVSPATVIRPVSPWLLGNNAAVWDGSLLLTDLTASTLKRAGTTILRFPGGSTSDEYCWDGNYASLKAVYGVDNSAYNQSWAVNTDEFITMCRAVGAEPMITVNFGLSRYGSVAEATNLAARWVKYCNVDHDYRVKYWEVGNENHGDWERGSILPNRPDTRLKGSEYGTTFNAFVTAMKAVDPNIKIGAVSVSDDDGNDFTGYFWWMRDMLPIVQDTADFLVVHNYFIYLGGTAQTTPAALFGNLPQIAASKARLDAMVIKYTDRAPGDMPYAHDEYNLENPNKHDSVELTNGLFTTAALGEFAAAGWSQAGIWDVYNGWDASTLGDFGILARDAPGIPDGTPRPVYYAFALWKRFGDTLVGCSSSNPVVKAYAGTYADGGLSVMLVNTSTLARAVTLDTGAGRRYVRANVWQLAGESYTSRAVTWNGVAGPTEGGGPQNVDAIPPWTLSIPANGPIPVTLAPFSASLLVLLPVALPGDVDSDGRVALSDAVMVCRIASGLTTPDARTAAAADLNEDGASTLQDAAAILRVASGPI